MPSHLRHRPDIDGLRAIAVLAVVFYHAGLPFLPGGFVGVDIFFVISGYLITRLIAADLNNGRFSLFAFYERRVRRIFPALFVVMTVSAAAGYLLLMPLPFLEFGESLGAAAAFASNILFAVKSGYFDLTAAQKPLLHTWSLAIEEQYYLVFPLLMIGLTSFAPRHRGILLATLAIASFGIGTWLTANNPVQAFYATPGRVWELLLGGLLSVFPMPDLDRVRANLIGGMGILLVAGAILFYEPAIPFPGWFALAPVLGAACVVYAGAFPGALAERFLRLPLLVFTGRISYSLYLWHWPLLVFAREYAMRPLSGGERVLAVSAAFLLAFASWRWVETPFRGKAGVGSRAAIFGAGFCVVGAFVAGAALVYRNHEGFPQRFPTRVQTILAASRDARLSLNPCFNLDLARNPQLPFCRVGAAGNAKPSFIVWGDSHAAAFEPAIADAAARHHDAGLVAARGGCPPLDGVTSSIFGVANDCAFFNATVMARIRSNDIQSVILVARWALYSEGKQYPDDPSASQFFIWDVRSPIRTLANNRLVLQSALLRTAQELAHEGRRVYIVGPVPEIAVNVPETMARRALLGRDFGGIGTPLAAFSVRQASVLPVLQQASQLKGVTVIYPHLKLCIRTECRVEHAGFPLYFDSDHLSLHGAEAVSAMFDPIFGRGATAH